MATLSHFHRLLVGQLAASAPERLRAGLTLAEIRETLLPYRRFRRALGVDMEEDYDVLLLQLAAAEDGLAALDDAGLLKLFQAESRSPNPDLLQLELHRDATLTLDPSQTDRALAEAMTAAAAAEAQKAVGDMPVAHTAEPTPALEDDIGALPLDIARAALQPLPPPIRPAPPSPQPASSAAADIVPAAAEPQCAYCGGALPTGRMVKFCPHCGQNQKATTCNECGAEAEIGWKHCVACGSGLPQL